MQHFLWHLSWFEQSEIIIRYSIQMYCKQTMACTGDLFNMSHIDSCSKLVIKLVLSPLVEFAVPKKP